MKEPARRWLIFADKDRQTCEQIKDLQGLRAIAAFHVQQTIEKSLKAILVCRGQNPPRIHDLLRLAALVAATVGESAIHTGELERINQYYTFSRYPQTVDTEDSEEPSAAELDSMVATGRKILDQARQLVERTPASESESGGTDGDDGADTSAGKPDHRTRIWPPPVKGRTVSGPIFFSSRCPKSK
jgi:HEPN domain-containing protein